MQKIFKLGTGIARTINNDPVAADSIRLQEPPHRDAAAAEIGRRSQPEHGADFQRDERRIEHADR